MLKNNILFSSGFPWLLMRISHHQVVLLSRAMGIFFLAFKKIFSLTWEFEGLLMSLSVGFFLFNLLGFTGLLNLVSFISSEKFSAIVLKILPLLHSLTFLFLEFQLATHYTYLPCPSFFFSLNLTSFCMLCLIVAIFLVIIFQFTNSLFSCV